MISNTVGSTPEQSVVVNLSACCGVIDCCCVGDIFPAMINIIARKPTTTITAAAFMITPQRSRDVPRRDETAGVWHGRDRRRETNRAHAMATATAMFPVEP